MSETRRSAGVVTLPASGFTAPPGTSPRPCFLTRSAGDSFPGTAALRDHPAAHRQGASRSSRGLPVRPVLGAVISVPPGQQVEIRLRNRLVRIYHRGRLTKTHVRQPRGGRATDPSNYPAEITAYTIRAPDRIKHGASEHGPAVAEFAERLFEGPLPWAKVRQGHNLLRLGKTLHPGAPRRGVQTGPGGRSH